MSELPVKDVKDTHAKALAVNLDATIYGSFAEIGAGQEVARWFLTVGAASGTVAKTMSAYDKTVSDDIYGAGTRYVSRERLVAMLDHEYQLTTDRLAPSRGGHTRFFAFADTVATRNFKGDNDQHGWIGLRFQAEPNGKPNDLLLHVALKDPAAVLQQQAIGVLGVNLLYSIHNARASAEEFLNCLWENLSIERMEIDVLEFSGPAFEGEDVRAWCLKLLRHNMAHAILFDTSFHVTEPSNILRKRPLLIDRGRFETLEPFHAAMLASATRALKDECLPQAREPQCLLELSLHAPIDDDAPDDAAILSRVKNMLTLGPAMVTNLAEAYLLVQHLRRHTAEPIRLVGGVSLIARILETRFYGDLSGALLEGMGRLFAENVKFYVYPMPREAVERSLATGSTSGRVRIASSASDWVSMDDLILAPPSNHLQNYLREAGQVVPIQPLQ